jgi:hypothetical protein
MKRLLVVFAILTVSAGFCFGQNIKPSEIDTAVSGIISDFQMKPAYVLTNQDTSDFCELDLSGNGVTRRELKWKYYDESFMIIVDFRDQNSFSAVEIIQKKNGEIIQYNWFRKQTKVLLSSTPIKNGVWGEKKETEISLLAFHETLGRIHGKLKSITVGKKPTKAP